MNSSRNHFKLFYLVSVLMCASCATPSMWVIKKTSNGGVIGASNYSGVSNKKIEEDLQKVVSCPTSFVIMGVENKSQSYQSSFVLKNPDKTTTVNQNYNVNSNGNSYVSGNVYSNNNYYRSTANFNANVNSTRSSQINGTTTITQDGGYSVVPYTSTVAWSEISYRCTNADLCLSGDSQECINLAASSFRNKDYIGGNYLLEKVCFERQDSMSSVACYSIAATYVLGMLGERDIRTGLRYLERGCELRKHYDKDSIAYRIALENCAFYGAYKNDRYYYDIGNKTLEDQCFGGSNSTQCFALACTKSVFGEKKEAIGALRRAINLGYNDKNRVLSEPDLNGIRGTKEFNDIVQKIQKTK